MSEAAWDEAGRLLARRSRSVAELREALRARGHGDEQIEATVERLRARGWLDDRRYALDFVRARAAERGQGKARVVADLERRGIPRELAEAAWEEARASGVIDPALELARQLERRLAGCDRTDVRALRRVYNALLRAGFEEASIRRLLEPHLDRSCPTGAGELPHELP